MKIKKIARYEESHVLLERGVDYQEEQLISDIFTDNKLKLLEQIALRNIAAFGGYSGAVWSGYEQNNTIEAIFRKELYL